MQDESNTLLKFPCYFPIKVIGIYHEMFINDIFELTKKYYPEFTQQNLKQKLSKENKFISLTITVYALDKPTLDQLYKELSAHPCSRMVL